MMNRAEDGPLRAGVARSGFITHREPKNGLLGVNQATAHVDCFAPGARFMLRTLLLTLEHPRVHAAAPEQ